MSRRTFALLCLVLGGSPAMAADDLSNFAFPEIDFDTVATASERSLLETAPAQVQVHRGTPQPAPPVSLPALTSTERPVATAAAQTQTTPSLPTATSVANAYASPSDLPEVYPVAEPTMLSYGPSSVSPLLAYMQCDPYSCGDVWAGYAAQVAADRAAYCALPNCHCGGAHAALHAAPCTSGCVGGHEHPHHRHAKPNRYTQLHTTPDLSSIGCAAGCRK